jgi:hypothetical protein
MRKLILIATFALASVAAQAGQSRNLVLAANDAPAATATTATTTTAAPSAATTANTAKPDAASSKPASKSKKPQARRETGEQKARRIAARYGISW